MALSLFNNIITETIVNLMASILILLIGLIIGRFAGKLIKKVLSELNVNVILKKESRIKIPFEEFISMLVKYIIYFIALIIALNQLGLTTIVFYITLTVIFILIGIFIILAVKDFIPNIVAGLMLHQKDSIKLGDKIRVKGVEGKIVHISLTETKIKTKDNDIIFIPNIAMIKNEVVKLRK
ncbi:MAG: mechanosensitive ion channel domain-containing protein [Nanoarchaeota archaeon]